MNARDCKVWDFKIDGDGFLPIRVVSVAGGGQSKVRPHEVLPGPVELLDTPHHTVLVRDVRHRSYAGFKTRAIDIVRNRDENLHVASSKPMRIWQGIFEITVSSRQHKTFTTALCATQKPYPPRFDRIFNASNSGISSPMTSLNVFSRHDAKASRGLVDAYTLTVI